MGSLQISTGLVLAALCIADARAEHAKSVVVYGDSVSLAGAGWPNQLDGLLGARKTRWTVVSNAINGNGLIWRTRCFGEPAMARLTSQFNVLTGEDTVVLMAGVNDLIQPRLRKGYSKCFDPGEVSATDITSALASLRTRLNSAAPRVLLSTIPPFAQSEFHTVAAEADRAIINGWIRSNWPSSDVINLDEILGSRDSPAALAAEFNSGDGLHPNAKGAAAIAAAVDDLIR